MIINQNQNLMYVVKVLECNFSGERYTAKALQVTFPLGKRW